MRDGERDRAPSRPPDTACRVATTMIFDLAAVRAVVEAALAEDVGRGDLTTQLTVPRGLRASAAIVAKQDGVLAGAPLVDRVFAALRAPALTIAHHVDDGAAFAAGTRLVSLEGCATDLLI